GGTRKRDNEWPEAGNRRRRGDLRITDAGINRRARRGSVAVRSGVRSQMDEGPRAKPERRNGRGGKASPVLFLDEYIAEMDGDREKVLLRNSYAFAIQAGIERSNPAMTARARTSMDGAKGNFEAMRYTMPAAMQMRNRTEVARSLS